MSLLISTLKARISPLSFYQRELGSISKRANQGWASGGLCPFHSDTRIGNFRVNIESGAFKCFACGAKGGDIISYVCLRYSKTVSKALEHLANEYM